MSKKITITISDEAYEHFCEVAYSLDNGDGKVVTHSQIINHCLLELFLFEKMAGQSVTGYLSEGWPEAYKAEIEKLSHPLVKQSS